MFSLRAVNNGLATYSNAVSDGVDLLEDTPPDVPFRRVGAVAVRLRQTKHIELQRKMSTARG